MKYEVLVANMSDPGDFYTQIIEVGDLPENEILMLLIAHPDLDGVGWAPSIDHVHQWCDENGVDLTVEGLKKSLNDCEETFILQIYNLTKQELYYRDRCITEMDEFNYEKNDEIKRRKALANALLKPKK